MSTIVDLILSSARSIFDTLLTFLYNLIFVDLKETAVNTGKSIFHFLFSMFDLNSFSLESMHYIFGFIFIVFVVKITISIIRG